MQRKIFISLDVPERTKNRLIKTSEKWQDWPVKWTRKENLHLTLAFLGYVDEANLLEIGNSVKKVVQNYEIFDLEFQEISFFPSPEQLRKIVLLGKNNSQLKNLVNDLEKKLSLTISERKTFRPHITLGKIKKLRWQELKEKPILKEKFPLIITATAVDIMANNFGENRNEYIVVKSCPLQ